MDDSYTIDCMFDLVSKSPSALRAVCERYGVKRMYVFGSVAANTAQPDSDLDLLVEFLQPQLVTYFTLVGLQSDLAGIVGLSGRRVHVTSMDDVPASVLQSLISAAPLAYAA